jgi:hypothetical protein
MIEQIFYQDAGDNAPMQLLQVPAECQLARGSLESGGLSMREIPGREVYMSAISNKIFQRLRSIASPGLGTGGIEFLPFQGRGGFSIDAAALESELIRCTEIIKTQRELAEDAVRSLRQAQVSSEPTDPQDRLMRRVKILQKEENLSFCEAWYQIAKACPEDLKSYQSRLKGVGADPRQAAGDELDQLAKQIRQEKGIPYSQAFDQATIQRPELMKQYRV